MKIILVLTPLMLALLYECWCIAGGKRPTQANLLAEVSLLTLAYFLCSAGTGIFWVATQELPVFDWHYLFGYLLLCLVSIHVALHWRALSGLLRRRQQAVSPPPDGRKHAGRAGWLLRMMLTGVFGGVVFLLGVRQGSQSVTVNAGKRADQAAAADSRNDGRQRATMLTPEGREMTLAQLFHEGSSYPSGVKLPGVSIRQRPAVYLDHDGPATLLPEVNPAARGDLQEAYDSWRTGVMRTVPVPLGLEQIATLLYQTYGISRSQQFGGVHADYRTAPSAGALYPVNLYLAVRNVAGLAPGLYYYHPKRSALILVRADADFLAKVARVAGSPSYLQESTPALVLFTASFDRSAYKYHERAYRYLGVDTGHAACNLAMSAAAIGWRAPLLARFDDRAIEVLMGLERRVEVPLLLMPLVREHGLQPEPRFLTVSAGSLARGSLLELIHGGSALQLAPGNLAQPLARHPGAPLTPDSGDLLLPAPATGKSLSEAIRLRRSIRNHTAAPLQLAELSALLAVSAGERTGLTTDPLLLSSAPVSLTAVVRQVAGLAAGIYRYLPGTHGLRKISEGDFSAALMSACIEQEVCGSADVVFVNSVRWDDLFWPDGDRGYRYATLRAGLQGEGLYLMSTALGLAVSGVGAFNDSDLAGIAGFDRQQEVALHLTAVGR